MAASKSSYIALVEKADDYHSHSLTPGESWNSTSSTQQLRWKEPLGELSVRQSVNRQSVNRQSVNRQSTFQKPLSVQVLGESSPARRDLPPFERCNHIRIASIAAVAVGFLISISCIVFSITAFCSHVPLRMIMIRLSMGSYEVISFAANVAFTFLADQLAYVHSTSLRWALYQEGRLDFNTNLRLFTSATTSLSNRWWANLLSISSLILCYASLSQISMVTLVEPEDLNMWSLNTAAILTLGLGLLGLTTISACCLMVNQHSIFSWSSNPLNTALVALHYTIQRKPGRSMLSVKHRGMEDNLPAAPCSRQDSAVQAERSVRLVLIFSWILGLIGILWLPLTWLVKRQGPIQDHTWFDDDAFKQLVFGKEALTWPLPLQTFLALILFCGIQGLQTVGLHCAELIVNMSRDEALWRRAADFRPGSASKFPWASGGASFISDPFISALLSWQNVVLFLLKAFLHWCFGQAIAFAYYPADQDPDSDYPITSLTKWTYAGDLVIAFRTGALLVYGGSAVLLAMFITYLALRKPKGPQPATWGHVQTLANLIDCWDVDENGCFWWGDKGVDEDAVRHAGTSCNAQCLEPVRMDSLYS
jgi:hypothetical protein